MLFSEMFGSHPSDLGRSIPGRTIGLGDSGCFQMPQMLLHPQARQMHSHTEQRSTRLIGDGMDVDEGSIQHQLPGDSSLMLEASRRHTSENIQVSGGLMRYHSAPSSMLANLVDVSEEFFPRTSSPLSQGADAEFTGFLADDLSSVTTSSIHCDTTVSCKSERSQSGNALIGQDAEQRPSEQLDRNRVVCHQSRFKRAAGNGIVEDVDHVPLCAIFEHGPEVNSDNFCSSQMAIPCTQQGTRTGHIVRAGSIAAENSLLTPATTYTAASQARSSLVRHSSSPAGLLSRLAMDACGQTESSERPGPGFSGPLIDSPVECNPESKPKENGFNSAARGPGLVRAFTSSNSFGARMSSKKSDDLGRLGGHSPPSKGGLLRQSSSPAGLLSQLSLDGIMEDGDELMMPSSSGNSLEEGSFDRRGGSSFFPDFGGGVWDDAVSTPGTMMHGIHSSAAFAARKRVRELDAKLFSGSLSPDCQQINVLERGSSLPNQFSLPTATSPESQLTVDKASSDAVLCRARAKRGCATHPRSIAERVRRTKISERMKKLQELVPNMDKQTNTADMLDEAVEYVKFLQRQVQELSENRPKCDGSCTQKAAT